MKTYSHLLVIAITGMSVTGCMTPQGQPDNTASGALGGAALGAIVGSAARHPGPGALVGAAVGAVGGGLIGHSMDQQQSVQAQTRQIGRPVEPGQPLTVADVKALAKAGMSDDLIISQIRNSHTVYHLGVAEIIDLKNSGVNEKVIDFMINTPSSAAVYVASSTAPVVETVTVAPYPYYYGWWPWYWGPWGWHGGWGGHGYGGWEHHGYGGHGFGGGHGR